MNPTSILLPVMALVGWTLLVLLLVPYRRFQAGFRGIVTMEDFKHGESAKVPGSVGIPNRNYMNLLEAPLLFYAVCFTCFMAQQTDSSALLIAWIYVGLRVVHSLIHLSYNNVAHRLIAFAASNVVLAVLWGKLALKLAA